MIMIQDTRMSPTTITFISGHYYLSARRAGFHNLADAAHRQGYTVNFVTAGYSFLSFLRRDYRSRISGIRANHNTVQVARPGFSSYVYFTLWHPMTLWFRALDRWSMRLMNSYGRGDLGALLPLVRETDIFVFESTPGLFLLQRFKQENPGAKYIYRVSDDIRLLRSTHPRLVELEQEIASEFDCVSIPAVWMQNKFPALPALRLDRHGVDKAAYDACSTSPYTEGGVNAICVSTWELDAEFVRAAATSQPDCRFHIIGPLADTLSLPNVRFYGEMPFVETLPYVKFADIGLHAIAYRNEHSRCFTDSLKVVQYRYAGLPIVAPDFLDLKRDGVAYYTSGDFTSCAAAMETALRMGIDKKRSDEVRSWDEVMADILSALP